MQLRGELRPLVSMLLATAPTPRAKQIDFVDANFRSAREQQQPPLADTFRHTAASIEISPVRAQKRLQRVSSVEGGAAGRGSRGVAVSQTPVFMDAAPSESQWSSMNPAARNLAPQLRSVGRYESVADE